MKHFGKKQIVLGVLLALILALNVYYLQMKSGYFVDEGMTLFLSNGNYNGAVTSKSDSSLGDFLDEFVFKDSLSGTVSNVIGMLKELTSAGNYSEEGTVAWYDAARNLLQGQRTWMDGEELFEQLTVSKGERFNYIRVFLNQAMDVHPPFYYLLVHTVFSLFPGSYSDSYLFAVNIIALLAACVVLWKLAGFISDKVWFPGLTVALFGFSQAFVSCALYFRMYAVFTFWTVLTFYLHMLLEKNDYKSSKKASALLIGTVVLGFYTHYYYIIFLFPVFIITVVKMMGAGKKRELSAYIKRMIIAGIISLIVWPLSLYHILFSYRGTEAASNLVTGGLMTRIKIYYGVISQAFFYNNKLFFLIVLLAGCMLLIKGLKKNGLKQVVRTKTMEILLICIFYMLIISQIAPAQSDRYIMCIFPMLAMLIAAVVMKIAELLIKNGKMQKTVLIGTVLVIMACSVCFISPNYLYLEQKEMKLGVSTEPSQMNCLMISDDDWRGFSEALDLSRFRQIIVLGEQELPILEEEKPDDLECDMIVYVLGELEQDSNLEMTCKLLGYRPHLIETVSSDIEGFNAYLFKMEGKEF